MCGLAGFLDEAGGEVAMLESRGLNMAASLAHRGPDAGAAWVDPDAGLVLAHRRLSIVDLSAAGAQPMISACGRWVIAYNGEIYNAAEVAREIPGIDWRGHSDTEVLLEACAAWGVARALPRFIGMFAFALWDRKERRLTLVRDRMGIKPLYYAKQGGLFLFGSELKALRAHPAFRAEIEPRAVQGFLHFTYVPGSLSIYRNVAKLLPGHMLEVDHRGERLSCWWNLFEHTVTGQQHLDDRPIAELVEELDLLLKDAVGRRMVADVPLGAFLSGGIDSSTVVALMQAQSERPIRTFAIGLAENSFNEADHARAVAKHLRTDHTELVVTPAEARDLIPGLSDIYDEPFADSSQIPTLLVSRLARAQVTVALSGDGGDEVFAGYTRYLGIEKLWRAASRLPLPLRKGLSAMMQGLSPETWDRLLTVIPNCLKPAFAGDKIHKASALFEQADPQNMYRRIVSQWPEDLCPSMVSGALSGLPWFDSRLGGALPDVMTRLRYIDMTTYLPEDILAKVDRASMAASLEARVPLLDHRVVEFAWKLPRDALVRGRIGKHILRQVLYRYVPAALVDRPKMGFGVPIGAWLKGPLRDWAEDLLSPSAIRSCGLLDPEPVRVAWQEHLSGRRNWQYRLWAVLMLQAWSRRWMFGVSGS